MSIPFCRSSKGSKTPESRILRNPNPQRRLERISKFQDDNKWLFYNYEMISSPQIGLLNHLEELFQSLPHPHLHQSQMYLREDHHSPQGGSNLLQDQYLKPHPTQEE